MNKLLRFSFLLVLITTSIFGSISHDARALKKVTLQLVWLDQFQFAGYYMAKEKGFYAKRGLDVEIKPFRYNMSVYDEVITGHADYGIGRSDLVQRDSKGEKVSLLAAIFQSSPNVLLALQSSNINSIKDFSGKRMMQTIDLYGAAAIRAMIRSEGVEMKSIKVIPHSFHLQDLITGETDLYSAYISNEPYLLRKKNIAFKIFAPKDYGFDFYSDILFTTKKYLSSNPKEVAAFREASLKGWRYAFAHIEETAKLIKEKYNAQNKPLDALIYEGKALKKLAYYHTNELGPITKEKIQRIYDVFHLFGLTHAPLDVDELVYQHSFLNKEERDYLAKKKVIKICVLPDSKPYSAVENGKYIGVGAQILEMTKRYFDVEYKLVPAASWMASLQKGENKECDLLPIAAKTPEREHFFNFTKPYHAEPLVIVTKKDKNYIIDFKTVLDKTFSIVRGHSFIGKLKQKYPGIKLVYVKNTKEGLEGVRQGKYYGHIDVLIGSAYGMKISGFNDLQIAGQFDKKILVRFATRKDEVTLYHIFDKVAQNIKPSELQRLLNHWVKVEYTHKTVFQYLWEVVGGFFIILLLFAWSHFVLKKKNKRLEELQSEISSINKQLESRVEEAVYELELAQEVANMGSWIFDVKNNTLRWSKQMYKIFALDTEVKEGLYDTFMSHLEPKEKDALLQGYNNSLKNHTPFRLEHKIVFEDGLVKHVVNRCETHYDQDGKAVVSYGAMQDVTQSVLLKEQLKQKDAYMLQQSRLAQMGEMLSMIAHQWKQPLGSIAATQVAMKTVLYLGKYDLSKEDERVQFLEYYNEKLEKIALHVHNLSQTIEDFSSFYKPHKKSQSLSVTSVVQKAYRLIEDSLHAYGIEVVFDTQADKVTQMHENEFMQVLLNLFNNASEQLREKKVNKPQITLRQYYNDENFIIEVEDNAGGVDEEILEKIFDPYFSTKEEKNGTGLGLYMSKIILKDYHNGDIFAKNSEDGAIFTIVLYGGGNSKRWKA